MDVKGAKGTYELIQSLGSGGNGEVWRAKGPNGEVAIKQLKAPPYKHPDTHSRFIREVETLQKLKGVEGVLPLIDVDINLENNQQPWFAMPLAISASSANFCRMVIW
ncbi:MAG TPA: hypothetical protein VKJ65_09080 [Phycisphaerae bacterium]|nr:hypothetical protein [Phycisphaerae bacterium]